MADSTSFRVADLPQNSATSFEIRPSGDALKELAQDYGILGLRKLRFTGDIMASGKRDWRLDGTLGATLVQECVVSLEPVTTRIDVPVHRVFVASFQEPDEPEAEMDSDDSQEPLGAEISPYDVMLEALGLAIPPYPRKDGAELGEAVYAEVGVTPMRDEDAKPFAGLAGLKEQLKDTN